MKNTDIFQLGISGSAQECVKECILRGFRESTYLAQRWSEPRFCSNIGWFAMEMTHTATATAADFFGLKAKAAKIKDFYRFLRGTDF